jgi:hypothetical protein
MPIATEICAGAETVREAPIKSPIAQWIFIAASVRRPLGRI